MASFEYKCRRCGEIEKNPHCGNEGALVHLLNAIYGNESSVPQAPKLIDIHSCNEMSVGVADLIGFTKD